MRGVRASRARLSYVLAQSRLKSQSALAEHMIDIEGRESPPWHLVNRIFRELPVDASWCRTWQRMLPRPSSLPLPLWDGIGHGFRS